MTELPFVSVVVVTYDDQANLTRVLDALERQVRPMPPAGLTRRSWFEVVVADDGSSVDPVVGNRSYPTKLVRQPDEGFRAAAARNLGVANADGGIVLFLDGDTVPEPGYVWALASAADAAGARAPGPAAGRGLAVGRRRHGDMSGLTDAQVAGFVDGAARPGPRVLGEPRWLSEGYRQTGDLADADARSYRFVISAVLALTRPLLECTGGFDESFVGYGGEDWDLAHRCWQAGAEMVHEPGAVAWHDGPDAAVRDERAAEPSGAARRKNRETRRLADVVPDPLARDPLLLWEIPQVAVELDDRGMEPELVVLTAARMVRQADARVWLREGRALRDGWWPATDPRVAVGPVPERVRARAPFTVSMDGTHQPVGSLRELCSLGSAAYPGVEVWLTRDRARSWGGSPEPGDPSQVIAVDEGVPDLEAEWGGWER